MDYERAAYDWWHWGAKGMEGWLNRVARSHPLDAEQLRRLEQFAERIKAILAEHAKRLGAGK